MQTSLKDGFARPSDHSSNSQTQTTTPFDLGRMVRSGRIEIMFYGVSLNTAQRVIVIFY
jgi:hypothetical protein